MSHKFFDFIEYKIAPVAGKIASQHHISAIRDGFINAMPFMIVGSFLLVFAFPPFSEDTTFAFGKMWLEFAGQYRNNLLTPFQMTMGIMSCYIVAGIAYNLSNHYKLNAFPNAMLALMGFLLISAPMTDGSMSGGFLGGTGVFTAIIVSIYSTEVVRFLKAHNIGFKLPEQVPDKIRQSFDLLIPSVVIIMTIYPLSLWLQAEFGMLLPELIMSWFKPLISASDTLPAILLAVFLVHILWFAGIHGAAIVGGIMQPFFLVNMQENQLALAAGEALPATFTEPFWTFFVIIGGSGATLGLVLLYLRSKSAHLKSLGKLGFIPALFNINEPIIFGSPIVMNPILFVPFMLTPTINAIIAYVAVQFGLIGKMVSLVPWTAPAPIGAAWGSGWLFSNGLLVLALIAVDAALYYPFFKIYEKQLIEQEEENTESDVFAEEVTQQA